MRTVSEIISAVVDQQPATDAELRLALLCMANHAVAGTHADFERASETRLRLRARNDFERYCQIMHADPEVWLGPRWTPGTPDFEQAQKSSKAILAAIEKKRKP